MKSQIKKPKTSLKASVYHNYIGEQKHQLLIVVDKEGRERGLETREKCHSGNGITHLAFMAFIKDDKDQIILARRSSKKSLWSGYWDCTVVSHILSGERPEEAVERRAKEEMGITMKFKIIGAFYYFAKYDSHSENEYCYVLTGKTDKEIHPNPIEIDKVSKISTQELNLKMKTNFNQFTPWLQIAWKKFQSKIK